MNTQLSAITEKTMSSLEIAKLTGKSHSDVLYDIRTVLSQAGLGEGAYSSSYKSKQNKELPCFILPRMECDLVISGYSVPYRLAIIKRWHELETKEQNKKENQKIRSDLRGEFPLMTQDDVDDKDSIRDYLTKEQKAAILGLQRANTVYIDDGLDFNARKEKLKKLFDRKYKQTLIDEILLLSA